MGEDCPKIVCRGRCIRRRGGTLYSHFLLDIVEFHAAVLSKSISLVQFFCEFSAMLCSMGAERENE